MLGKIGSGLWVHRWFSLVVILALGVGAWQSTRVLVGTAVVVDLVKRGDLVQSVVASGHVETPYRVDIGSQITGMVEDVKVEEGQSVHKGDVLITLEARELRSAVVETQGAVAQAESRLRQLEQLTLPSANETLKEAQANLVNAQKTYDRAAELVKNGYETQANMDNAQKNLDIAKTQVRTAQLQVFTNSPSGSDYVMAQSQINQAHANYETAQSRLAYATITAPRDGVLISRNVERGAVVQPGKALLVLAPSGETQLVLQIDERNLGLLALGQSALASADAYPEQKFDASISYINPGVDISNASIQVKLKVTNPPAYLRQDMTVSVDIETAKRSNTLVLPARDIHDPLSGNPWVLGIRDGRAAQIHVKLGLHGTTQTEILDGLNEADTVIPANSGVISGQRVRVILP
jgi:HlyD family secretion protein